MSTAMIYTIHYLLHGEPKTFVVRAEVMNNAEAWHWAAVDADIPGPLRVRYCLPVATQGSIWAAHPGVGIAVTGARRRHINGKDQS